jgi:hypothetical protein
LTDLNSQSLGKKAVYDPDWQLPPIDLVEKKYLLGCSSAKIRCPSA